VFLDPASPMASDASGSIAVCGSLGSGKSHLLKLLGGSVYDRGGLVTVIDRSQNGEWEAFAASVADPTVVRILNPEYSLDPIRLFSPARAARAAQMFFGTLLNIEPMSAEGAALSAVLSPEYLERHHLASAGELLRHLKSEECTVPKKDSISGLMDVVATKDYGAVIFDPDLPAMPTDSRFIVFRTIGVELPRHEELASDHRFRNLPVDKKFGSSVYGLILEISRELCLADPTQLAVFIGDEAHHLTGFPAGEEAVADFLRVARKDLAFLILGSHDPSADFGSETLRGLINIRILMRQESKILAARGLEFLELDSTDQQLMDEVRKDLSPRNWKNPATGRIEVHPERRGEALIRDSALRYAKIRVLPAARPDRAKAALTSPPMPNEREAA
jgi:energy-coupling factor transporter ATP-binding protein EcfA2